MCPSAVRPDPHSPSDERVLAATGRTWNGWFALLDDAEAASKDHKGIVSIVAAAGGANAWWQQTVTVAYEKARGLRSTVGETADAGFQVGVRRTLPLSSEVAWHHLVEGPGRADWLGPIEDFDPTPGATFQCDDDTVGDVRSVQPGRRLRLTWQPVGWTRSSTLQLTVQPKDDRCVVAIHHERLADERTRHEMQQRWTKLLDSLREAVAESDEGRVG